MKWKLFLFVAVFLMSCATRKNPGLNAHSQLRFLGEYLIPLKQKFKGTTVGGLSGIDYDSKNAIYYLISDDGSKIDPARFYTAKIELGEKGIDTVQLLNVTTLLQPNDSIYPYSAIDPEAIRYHPVKHQLFWSSEGEKMVRKEGNVLFDPSIQIQSPDGKWLGRFELPVNMHIQNAERGPRSNGSFEGLTFTGDYKTMYVNVEEPLYEDGPRAGTGDSSAWTRILKFDVKTRKPLAQYAYPIDPVAYPPSPAGAFKINGASEILWVGKDRLLVIERSFSTSRQGCVIKIYLADLSGAEDVSAIVSLKEQKSKKPVSKKMLLNMESLGIPVYNIEGVTFGPQLPNGHKTLVFVADDNFSAVDKTQFLLFEIY
jgi:hypothetical protein